MRVRADWRVRLIGLLLIACCGVGGYLVHASRPPADATEGALVAAVAASRVVATHDSVAHVVAMGATDRVIDTLRRRVVLYDTLRRTILLDPRTPDDTVRDIAALPGVILAADGLRTAAVALTDTLRTERERAAQVDADRRQTITAQEALVTQLRHRPRLSGTAGGMYDPIARAPSVALRVDLRAAGGWSIGTEAEYRIMPSERPRVYLTVSRALF